MRMKLLFASLWYCIQGVIVIDLLQCTTEVSAVNVDAQGLVRNLNHNELPKQLLRIEAPPPLGGTGARVAFLDRSKTPEYSKAILKYYYMVKITYWEVKKMTPEMVFTKLHLDMKKPENVFENPKFLAWAWFAKRKNGNKHMYQVLRYNGYKSYEVTRFCEQRLRLKKTDKLASDLLKGQREMWRDLYHTPDKVFKELNLAGIRFFKRTHAFQWIQFVHDNEPDKTKAMNKIFSTILDANTAEDVVKICQVGSTLDDEAKRLAKELETAQRESWLNSGMTVEELFKDLNLKGPDLFKLPLYSQWISLLKEKFNRNNEQVKKAFISTIVNVNSEKDVAEIYEKSFVLFNYPLTSVKEALFTKWRAKTPLPTELFIKLDLQKLEGQDLFMSPLFFLWTDFAEHMPKASLKSFLNDIYGAERFNKMLKDAKADIKTSTLAVSIDAK